MSDETDANVEIEPRPDPLDCGSNVERERRVAQFLVERLSDVDGVTRIYFHRAGGRIDFTVEVEEFGGVPMDAAHDAFYHLRREGISTGVDLLVREYAPERRLGPEHTIWLSGQ